MRLKGHFSIATVNWMLIGRSSNLVLSPHNGTLMFQLDEPKQTIYIEISGKHVCHWSFQSFYLFCNLHVFWGSYMLQVAFFIFFSVFTSAVCYSVNKITDKCGNRRRPNLAGVTL